MKLFLPWVPENDAKMPPPQNLVYPLSIIPTQQNNTGIKRSPAVRQEVFGHLVQLVGFRHDLRLHLGCEVWWSLKPPQKVKWTAWNKCAYRTMASHSLFLLLGDFKLKDHQDNQKWNKERTLWPYHFRVANIPPSPRWIQCFSSPHWYRHVWGVRTSLAMLPILWAKSLAALVKATLRWLHGEDMFISKRNGWKLKIRSSKIKYQTFISPNPSRTRSSHDHWWSHILISCVFSSWICNHKKLNWQFCGKFVHSQHYDPRTYLTQRLETESIISSRLDFPRDCHLQMQGGVSTLWIKCCH